MDILYILKGIIIAIVEGLTEFLPVSSTGHLIITGHFLNFPNGEFERMFMVVIQLGAILAIVYLYWNKLLDLVIRFFKGDKAGKKFVIAILVGILPAFVFGMLLNDLIDEKLFNVLTVIIGLFVGALLLLYMEKKYRGKQTTYDVDKITPLQAIKVGLFQCLSLWPGMSRSSSTIIGGWYSKLSPELAAEYSFFLAIPIMVGASFLKLYKFSKHVGFSSITSTQTVTLALGMIVSFVVALLCVKAFIGYIRKRPMKVFAYYRIAVAALLFTVYVATGFK